MLASDRLRLDQPGGRKVKVHCGASISNLIPSLEESGKLSADDYFVESATGDAYQLTKEFE